MLQEREGPLFLEHLLGRQIAGRLQAIAGLGIEAIERNHGPAAAALFGACPVEFIGQEMFECRKQEGAELALLTVDFG